jgi:hypothetical protein
MPLAIGVRWSRNLRNKSSGGSLLLDPRDGQFATNPEVMDQHFESVEHPFGSIKQWMGQRNFLTRRIENVRGEFSLTALAYNIRRALTLVGVVGLSALHVEMCMAQHLLLSALGVGCRSRPIAAVQTPCCEWPD